MTVLAAVGTILLMIHNQVCFDYSYLILSDDWSSHDCEAGMYMYCHSIYDAVYTVDLLPMINNTILRYDACLYACRCSIEDHSVGYIHYYIVSNCTVLLYLCQASWLSGNHIILFFSHNLSQSFSQHVHLVVSYSGRHHHGKHSRIHH
jgi:hypothetical protein